jgi:predicted DsbA family dithiol-disulfide isomerase
VAVGQLGGRAEVVVRWHPFELAPNMPPEGQNVRDYSRERYGATPEQGLESRKRITDIGSALGIDFRFTPESRIYNTRKAHQLLLWSGEQGKQTALKMALFDAYFTGQANVSDDAVLLDVAESVGLDRAAAASILSDRRYADAVSAEIAHWVDQNVTGVPAFVINQKYMVPGAQDAETFGRIFDRVLAA